MKEIDKNYIHFINFFISRKSLTYFTQNQEKCLQKVKFSL